MKAEKTKIQKLEEKLTKAKTSNNINLIIETLEAIIDHHKTTQHAPEFVKRLLELLPYYQRQGNKRQEAQSLVSLARAYNVMGDYDQSIQYCKNALDILEGLDDKLLIAETYRYLGDNHRIMGDYDESLTYFSYAIGIYNENIKLLNLPENAVHKKNFADTLELAAIVWGSLNQKEKARELFHQVLGIQKNIKNPFGIAKTLNNLGVSYSEENPQKTMEYYKKALKIANDNNFTNMSLIYINNIGGVYEDIEKYDNALHYYHKALEIANIKGFHKYKGLILKHIGTTYIKKKSYDLALQYLNKSLKLLQKNEQRENISEVYQLISQAHKGKKDYKLALDYHEKHAKQEKIIFNEKMLEKISGLQKKYEESQEIIQELKAYNSLISETLKKSMNMNMVGKSKKIKEVLDLAMVAAETPDTNILIRGESGTGKEIIAHIIHYASQRKKHLFIPVNTSSVPESLVESEFFGYVKGAFTGATKDKAGYIELANKGTLFLDEIADTPSFLQAKLLRILENKKIKRLGSEEEIAIDFRLVAATNKNLEKLIKDNKFRLDLLYRLNTIEIYIPPLRERLSDIEHLLNFFVDEFAKSLGKPKPKIDPAVIKKLKTYHFPGNVRELRNMVEKAMILLTNDTLTPNDFILKKSSEYLDNGHPPSSIPIMSLAEMEKQMIISTLKKTNNNKTKAAKILGISRMTLIRKCGKMKIE